MTALFLSLPPSLAFLFLSFLLRSSGSSLSLSLSSSLFAPQNPTKPTLHRPCLYNVMACASIVPTAGHHSSCAPPLRDSLSAFVWHFITPPDCRIKHPAKGISTLSACTIVVAVVLSCVHFHEDYFPDSFRRVCYSPFPSPAQKIKTRYLDLLEALERRASSDSSRTRASPSFSPGPRVFVDR